MAAGTRVLEARATLGVAIGEFYPQTQQIGANVSYNQASAGRSDLEPDCTSWGITGALRSVRRSRGSWISGASSAAAWNPRTRPIWPRSPPTTMCWSRCWATSRRPISASARCSSRSPSRSENVVKQKKALQIARDRYHGGTATELDVFQAENVLAQTESTVPQLTAQLQQGEDALRVLLGMTPQSLDCVAGRPADHSGSAAETLRSGSPPTCSAAGPISAAPSCKAAAQSAQIGLAKADLFPAFTLAGAFGTVAGSTGSNRVNEVFSARGIQFAFGPSFSWPILNYGQITNNVRVQDARLQTLLIDYKNTVLKAQQEVENSLSAFLQGRQQVALLRRSVAAANSALRIAT